MNVALLNVNITFQKNTVVVDAIGNHKTGWEDYYSCHATISDSTGKSSAEQSIAGIVADTADISFTVRYCRKAAVVTSTGYRILWNGEIYDILKIDHLNMKKHALKFQCQKVRR